MAGPHPGLSITEISQGNLTSTIYDSILFDLTAGTPEKKRLLYETHYKLARFLEGYCNATASLRRKNIRFFLLWEYGTNMNNKYLFSNSLVYSALHNPDIFSLRFTYGSYWKLYELVAT